MTLQVLAHLPYTYLPSGILVIEPNEGLRVARSMLLSAADQQMHLSKVTASDRQLHDQCEITFAVLSESLGYGVLSESALIIRKSWPNARILVLGRSGAAIEDHLYDARIERRPRSEDLLAALLMLAEYPQDQRASPRAVLGDSAVGRFLKSAVHWGNEESDPTKRFANDVQTTYSRDMPSEEQHLRKAS